MRLRAAAFAVLAFLIPFSSAYALDVSGRSRTYLLSREAVDSSDILPFFEFLDFRAEDIGARNISFHFGGWLRYDLRHDSAPGKDKNSDLQYAYLRIRGERADAALDLGRILVNEGVASEQLDGAYARTALLAGFTVAAFGGTPVETSFDDRSGDSVYGGRISHGAGDVYRIGFSFLKEKNGRAGDNGKELSRDFRKEEGLDIWLRPIGKVELLGSAFYNAITRNRMYQTVFVTFGPFDGVRLTGHAMNVNYGDYFTSSTTTAFKFDPTIIDPAIEMTLAGGEASYSFLGITLSGDYKKYSYRSTDPLAPDPGDADHFGGRLDWSVPKKGGMGVSYHRMDGETDQLRYNEYRGYASRRFGAFDITADYLVVRYDTAVNGVKTAYTTVLAGGWDMTKTLRLAVDTEYGHNPFYDKEVRGLVKLVYNFSFTGAAAASAPAAPATKGKERKGK